MNPVSTSRSLTWMLAALTGAIILIALTSAYSAHTTAANHHASCARIDLIADSVHDIIVLAFTPGSGLILDPNRVARVQTFEAEAFRRIEQARC
jgi:hypothetical protein